MAVKSILDIEVNDAQFKAFIELFDKYQGALGDLPKDWAKVGAASKGSFDAIAAALLTQNELFRRSLKSTKDISEASSGAAISWATISRHTRDAAANITGAARALLKWTAAATFVSGLLGAGGLFGIDRLGAGVTAGRRQAAGLGVSYGQQQSFGLNFGRFVDPGAVLGSVSTGLYDVTSPEYVALLKAGISPDLLAKGNAADIGAALLQRVPQLFGNVPANQRGTLANVLGFSQLGIGTEEINRYLKATPAERQAQQQAYARDTQGLGLTGQQQRAWNDLTTQLQRAGRQIENTFVVGLAPLLPGLEKLSGAFADTLKAFLESKDLKRWIDEAGTGLETFAKYLGSPEFKTNVESFIHALGEMAAAIERAVTWLRGETPEEHAERYKNRFRPPTAEAPAPSAPVPPATLRHGPNIGRPQPPANSLYDWLKRGGATYDDAITKTAFSSLEGKQGLPPGLLWLLEGAESGHRTGARSPAGAVGSFQFLPDTARQYGVADPTDRIDAGGGAARYLRKLLDEFKGDLGKAIAAYNWGEGNVERDIKRYGGAWREHLPAETRRELDKVLGGIGPDQGTSIRGTAPKPRPMIEVRNNTGGSAVIIATQLAV